MQSLGVVTVGVAVAAAAFGIVSGAMVLAGHPLPIGRLRSRSRLDGWAQVLMGVFCAAVAAGALLNRSATAILVLMPIGLIALGVALGLQVKSARRL